MLTTLGSVGGQRGDADIQTDKSGMAQSSTAKSYSRPNGETGSQSSSSKEDGADNDDDEASSRLVRPLQFKISDEVETTECEHASN
jgi:hypothetical protein